MSDLSMNTVVAEFDGRVFVPVEPVNLPVGSKVAISLTQLQPPGEPTGRILSGRSPAAPASKLQEALLSE